MKSEQSSLEDFVTIAYVFLAANVLTVLCVLTLFRIG
jgi:hypothetical protein